MKKLILAIVVALGLAACGGGGGSGEPAGAQSASLDALAGKPVAPTPALVGQPVSMVNTTTAGDQVFRNIGALANGGYAVAWSTGDSGFVQNYDSAGAKAGGEIPVAAVAMAVLGDGSIVSANAATKTVTATRFDASGALLGQIEVAVDLNDNPARPSFFRDAQVLALADGGFVVGWVQVQATSIGILNQVQTRRYDSQGQPAGDITVVTSVNAPAENFAFFNFTADAEGGYTITVTQPNQLDPSIALTSLFHFDSTGAATEIVSLTPATVLLLPLEGERFVLFTSDTSGTFRQFLDSAGAPVGDPVSVPTMPVDARELADGSFAVFWDASGILMFQRFDSAGAAMGSVQTISTHVGASGIAALSQSGFAAAWSGPSANQDLDVFTTRFVEALTPTQAELRARRKACVMSAKGMHGQERKAFVDACIAA